MLTLHTAPLLVPGPSTAGPALPDGAVAVRDGAIVAVGPYGAVAAAHPGARTRRWPGVLAPGLVHPGAAALLDEAYHPDPREADRLGTEPLTGAALAALAPDDARWGASARRGLQRMLRHGVTAVAGPFRRAPVRTAVARAGVTVVRRTAPQGRPPSLDPLAVPADPADAFAGALTPGARADLAAFEVLPGAGERWESGESGGPWPPPWGRCVATVLAGRMVHRAG